MEEKPKSAVLQEMERRANDLIRVFNPTEKDFVVKWDKKNGTKLFRVTAKSEVVLIRYIAEKYIMEMYQEILNERADRAVREENEKRISKGIAEMSKFKDQLAFESRVYNPSDEDAKKIIAVLYVGVENEFGVDREMDMEDESIREEKPVVRSAMESVMAQKTTQNHETIVPAILEKDTETEEVALPTSSTPKVFKCDYPGCNFSSTSNIGLQGHKRSHRKDLEDSEKKKQEAMEGVSA